MAIEGARPNELGTASRYESLIDVESDSTHAIVVRLVGWHKRVLELGCATGYMSAVLQHRGCQVVGVELDAQAAEKARSYCERVIVADLDELDLAQALGDDRFDVVIAADVLEHLKNPEGVLRALRSVLKPGGCIVASIPNIAHGSVRLALLGGEFNYNPVGLLDSTHLRFFTRESIHELFEDAAFVVTRLERRTMPIDVAEVPHDHTVVPSDLLERLRADRDAQTYQFIIVAHPVGSTQLQAVRRRTRQLIAEMDDLRAELVQARAQLVESYEEQLTAHRGVIGEYQQRAVELEEQVATQTRWAQASAANVAERDATIVQLQSALEQQSRDMQDLQLRLHDTATWMTARVREANNTVAFLNRELVARQTEVERLSAEVAEQQSTVEELRAELAAERHQTQQLGASLAQHEVVLADLRRSQTWRFLVWLWHLRSALLPPGSRRQRALTLPGRALQAARHEGVTGFARTVAPWRARVYLRRTLFRKAPAPTMALALSADAPLATSERAGNGAVVPHMDLRDYPRPSTYDVVVFPIIDWSFRYQRPQQIAMRFARHGHRVLYCGTQLNAGTHPTVRPIVENVLEVHLPGPPTTSLYTDQLTEGLLETLLQGFAELRDNLGMVEAVVLVDLPFWAPLAFRLREQYGWKVVYDCMDQHSGFSTVGAAMLRAEDALSRGSDLVLATSRSIHATQAQLNPRCVLVPNAADFEHFRFALPLAPDDIRDVPRPIVGYYGAVSDWLDTALVGRLARARPQWQFVLIGSTFSADLSPLQGCRNVHLLGEKPYDVLPAYLHAFDVCMIPFKRIPLTEATNPVKLFEYLSAGKSVVATRLAEMSHYAEHVALATTDAEWLAALDQALEPVAPTVVRERVEFARQNSWDARVQAIRTELAELHPLVSIIIVTYNNEDYTRVCLQSIYEKTVYPHFEVVVVDNASHDGTRELLERYQQERANCVVLFNEDNRGFAAANNQGLAAARGEYVVFLNNDTVVTRGWLTRLLYHLRDPEVGMVGPVTNSSGNESRIEVGYATIAEMEAFAAAYTRRHFGETFRIRMLALFCVAMRRAAVEDVGLLDERFGIGMFEDDDYALRVKERGYRILCAEDVFIHHWGSASFSKLADAKYRALFDENLRKFEEKWGRKWEPHQGRAAKAS